MKIWACGEGGDGVAGYVVSDAFCGVGQIERQNMVWSYLKCALNESDARRVRAMITMTFDEAGD